jgi:nucleoside-diphosphate-sugar epimerase
MNAERILVTGASGFTGGHLCRRLTEAGYRVRGLVRDPARCATLLDRGVEIVSGDLRDADSLHRAVKGIDVVYHVAAVYRQANISRREMWEVNVQGTKYLLDAAAQSGVKRFVHCSSMGVHGRIKNPPGNEETPYGPGDEYQESKVAAERVVRQYMDENRIQGVVFRPAGIYGPGDLRFLKLFRAIKNGRFVMLGSGRVNYHMIYIDDLIEGILLCGTDERSVGGVYILGNESPVMLNQLIKVIAATLGVRSSKLRFPVAPIYIAGILCELVCKPFGINPPLYRRRVDFFRKNRAFDVSKAKKELGFRAKTSLETGIALTAGWYQAQGLL